MTVDNRYQSPNAESPTSHWNRYSPEYNGAMKTALAIQAMLAIVTALVLDSGRTHRAFWVAILCQWAMVCVILIRRPMCPTRLDLSLVRYGIVPLLFIVASAGPWFLRLLGVPM